MKLYLDDDTASALLVRLFGNSGHDVQIPADVGMSGEPDPIHLTHAISSTRVMLSANHDDFADLHELIRASGGKHPGIIAIRFDNDRRRDMSPGGIVRALTRMIGAKIPLENEFVILNQWR